MSLYAKPDIVAGDALTGANLNTYLSAIATATGAVTVDRFDPEARFDASLFVQNASCGHMAVVGMGDRDNAVGITQDTTARTITFYARTDGKLSSVTAWDNTAAATTTLTVTKDVNGVATAMAVGDTVVAGDKVKVTAAAGVTGAARWKWRLVGAT